MTRTTDNMKQTRKLNGLLEKVIVNLASAEEENELREILHENGFKWNSGDSLLEYKFWNSGLSNLAYHLYAGLNKFVIYSKGSEIKGISLSEFKEKYLGKGLNLCELLKGCEGEEFFSISVGKVTFKAIYNYDDTHPVRTIRKDAVGNEYNVNFYFDGRRNNAGLQDLYPSEDLLRKYPLDARAAWDEWASVRKPKRWYPQHGEEFWYIDLSLRPQMTHSHISYSKWEGELNCFQTEELCQQAAEAVRETLEKFHEKHTEQ